MYGYIMWGDGLIFKQTHEASARLIWLQSMGSSSGSPTSPAWELTAAAPHLGRSPVPPAQLPAPLDGIAP